MKIWGTYLGLLLKAQTIKNKKAKPQKLKTEYYKISEWNEDLCGYVVKHCSLSKEKANALCSLWTVQGRYVRVSPQIEKKIKSKRKRK